MKRFPFLLILLFTLWMHVEAQTNEDSVTLANAHWEKRHPAKGITTLHAQFANLYGGPQDIYVAEVSLRRHPLRVLDHQGRALTSEKARDAGACVAINGTYFDMGETARSVCFVAQKGRVVEYSHSSVGQLSNGAVIMQGKKVKIEPWEVEQEHALYPDSQAVESLAGKDVMVCGPLLVQHGREVQFDEESHVMQRHPRSGVAVRGKKALLVVIDGRDTGRASGVTIPQFAHFMRMMKMDSALNLDGGGSSTLWVRDAGILNCPSDSHGRERTVSNSIVVLK